MPFPKKSLKAFLNRITGTGTSRRRKSNSPRAGIQSLEGLEDRKLLTAQLSALETGLEAAVIEDQGNGGGYFAELQSELNENVLSVRAPIGGALVTESVEVSGSQFVADVASAMATIDLDDDPTAEEVQAALTDALTDYNAQVTIDSDTDADKSFGISVSKTYEGIEVDLDLVGADPNLEVVLGGEDQVNLELTWNYDIVLGVRENADGETEFHIDSTAEDELTLDYTATLKNGFAGFGKAGILIAEFETNDESQFDGDFVLDVGGNMATPQVTGSLTGAGTADLNIDAAFFPSFASAESGLINLGVTANGIVSYDTDIQFQSDGTLDTANNNATIDMSDVTLDLGSLYSDFVNPLVANVQAEIEPIRPLVDFLTEPIPVLSDLSRLAGQGNVRAIDLHGVPSNLRTAVTALETLLDYNTNTASETGEIAFSYSVDVSSFDPDADADIRDRINKIETDGLGWHEKHTDPDAHSDPKTSLDWDASFGSTFSLPFLTDPAVLAGFLTGDDTGEFFTFDATAAGTISAGIDIPIAPLLNMVELNFGLALEVTANVGAGYDAVGVKRLTDEVFADSTDDDPLENRNHLTDRLNANQAFLMQGFYLDDHHDDAGTKDGQVGDGAEFTIGASISAGVTAGVDLVIAGIEAGGTFTLDSSLEFDVNDLPEPAEDDVWLEKGLIQTPTWSNIQHDNQDDWEYDGRVRLYELATIADVNPGSLFNTSGSITAELSAHVEAFFLGVSVWREDFELAKRTLVRGSISQSNDYETIKGNQPVLGTLNSNGDLNLHMGPTAHQRTNTVNQSDGAETFFITSLGASEGGGETLLVTFLDSDGKERGQVFENVDHLHADGGSGDDTIEVLSGVTTPVTLNGGDGNDTLIYSGSGTATLNGGAGNDILSSFSTNTVTINGGAGDDIISGGSGDDILSGGLGNDTLTGGAGDDIIFGNEGDDTVRGGVDNDSLFGGVGNDQLAGGNGDDTLRGGDGDDILLGGQGADSIFGEAGNDSIQFFSMETDDAVDLLSGGIDTDTIEILGTNGDDHLTIQQISNTFSIENSASALDENGNLVTQTGSFQFSRPADFSASDIENLQITGRDGDDKITAIGSFTGNALRIDGGEGNDILKGADSRNILIGGNGDDTLIGGNDEDEIHGGDGNDIIDGVAGSDVIYGGAGADIIFGGTGRDVSYGGEGNDTIFSGEGYVTTQLGEDGELEQIPVAGLSDIYGDTVYGGDGDDTLEGGSGADHLYGGNGNDTINGAGLWDVIDGGSGDDILDGGSGKDTITGGAGHDTLYAELMSQPQLLTYDELDELEDELDNDREQFPEGSEERKRIEDQLAVILLDKIDSLLAQNVITNTLSGEEGDDHLYGSIYSDTLNGNDGDDTIYHSTGNDTVFGGTGTDEYVVSGTEGGDQITLQFDQENSEGTSDVVVTLNGESVRATHQEIEHIGVEALAGNDTVTLNFGVNAARPIRVDGGAGDDVIDIGTFQGTTDLTGGAGNDTIQVRLKEADATGNDNNVTVTETSIRTELMERPIGDFEKVWVVGNSADNTFDVSEFEGDVTLDGLSGDDTFKLGSGDSDIKGGDGLDTIDIKADADFTLTDEVLSGWGTHSLEEIEAAKIIGGASNNEIRATQFQGKTDIQGLDGDDKIYGGRGSNRLSGGNGDDVLRGSNQGDEIYGGRGNDSLHGFSGNDTLSGGDGNDLLFGSDGNDTLIGGDGNDQLYGHDGDDSMDGGNDNDRIVGGDGNDVAYGGAGNDIILGMNGNDEIFGEEGNDSLYGDDLIGSTVGNDTIYGGSGNDQIKGGRGEDTLVGGTGDDRLWGESGHDVLHGSSGNDFLYGGEHNDTLYGGSGSDTIYGNSGNDFLDGGRDWTTDYLYGGPGTDTSAWYPSLINAWWFDVRSGVERWSAR